MNIKNILMLLVLLLNVSNTAQVLAQSSCPQKCTFPEHSFMNQVNLCEDGLKYSISRDAIVGNTVVFSLIAPIPLIKAAKILFLDADANGNAVGLSAHNLGNSPLLMTKTEDVSVTFNTTGKKIMRFTVETTTNHVFVSEANFEIKAPLHLYESPDAVWKIETPTAFDPASAGAQSSFFSPALQQFLNKTKGVGFAYVRYGKTNGVKRNYIARPIIYVDGIDFNALTSKYHDPSLGGNVTDESNIIRCGSTGWDIFITGTDASILKPNETEPFQLYRQHFNEIQDNGYDMIFLDFADGATYMQKNAEVLIELLKQVNGFYGNSKFPNRKKVAINGINYENIIVGPSMGGQVAKFALAKMEYEERTQGGPSHCTKMYVSFDSPHKGANIPIGIQGAAWFFDKTCANTSLWKRLNQPAARQLLIQHLANASKNGEVTVEFAEIDRPNQTNFDIVHLEADGGVLRKTFLDQLKFFGEYPSLTNNLAIADGATTFQAFTGGDDLIDEKITGAANFHAAQIRIQANGVQHIALASNPYLKTDFGCQTSNVDIGLNRPFVFGGITPVDGQTCAGGLIPPPNQFQSGLVMQIAGKANTTSFDNAPGSYRRDLRTIHDELSIAAKSNGSSLLVRTPNFDARTTFIHTLSALDPIGLDMTDANFARDLRTEIKNDSIKTPFEATIIPSKTLQHVEINQEILTWVNEQLSLHSEDLALNPTLSTTYNYGLVRKTIPNLNINTNGFLRVNNNTKTAFLNEDRPDKPIESYTCYLTSCGGSTVNVNAGGSFILGNEASPENMKGIVIAPRGARINVQGGTLRLVKGSEVILEDNSNNVNLGLTSGSVSLYQASKITINKGAYLKTTGGTLTLYNNSQIVVQQGGKMDVLGGQLTLQDQSQIVVQQGGILTISAQGYALLSGSGKLIVEKGGIVQVLGSARMHINVDAVADIQGQAVFKDNAECIIQHQGTMDISGVSSFESGTLAMKDNGIITTHRVTPNTGIGTLELYAPMYITMNNDANIHIISNSNIRFLGKDDEVIIRGGSDEQENTPIILESQSNWFVESAMWLRGSAYFKIFGEPSITSPVSKFKLRGDGKRINSSFKLMELMEAAVLLPNTNTSIEDGKIVYHSGLGIVEDATHIELPGETNNSNFSNIYFKTLLPNSQYTVALQDVHTNNVPYQTVVVNCLFDGLDKGLWMNREATRTYKAEIEVRNSIMKNIKVVGIDTKNFATVLVKGCNITSSVKIPNTYVVDNYFVPEISKYAPAIRFIGKNSYNQAVQDKLTIENSMIRNQVNWQLFPEWVNGQFNPDENYAELPVGFPPNTEEMSLNEESYLVGLYGGNLIVDKASEIYDGYYGILAFPGESEGDPRGSMVTIKQCSKIHDNYAGIVYDNEEIFLPYINHPVVLPCTVLLEKAQITNNTWGIYGKNIIVDANLITQRSTNTFSIRDGLRHGHYICIHYTPTASPSGGTSNNADLIAPINYWINGTPQKGINYLLNRTYMIDPFPEAYQIATCLQEEIIEYNDEEAVMIDASILQKAEISVGGVTKALLPIYWRGITQHLKGQYQDAVVTMEEITDIPLGDIEASTNPYVHYYHNIAWSIAAKQLQQNNIGKEVFHSKNVNGLLIYPNPANESFTIQVISGTEYDVTISDMLGKTIKTINISGTQTISTNDMTAGMYQVTMKNRTDNAITTQKLVVNK